MAKRTRSKSFFVSREPKNASFESFKGEVKNRYEKMEQKRKFCGTKPLKRGQQKFEVEFVELKNVCRFDFHFLL